MESILFSDNFVFFRIEFENYHYTDNRKGAPKNYVAYMKKGNARIVSQNDTIIVNEGDVFYIPKNLSYQSYWYGDDKIEFLSLSFHSLNINENNNYKLQIVECDEEIIEKINKIPAKGREIDCKSLSIFYDVMSELIPKLKYTSQSNGEMTINRIKKYMCENPESSIDEVAVACGISESYLYALFKKYSNITANDYKQKLLCEKGIELLLTTNKKIEEISALAGFSSSSYFRKVLMKHTGKTPKEIRKNREM